MSQLKQNWGSTAVSLPYIDIAHFARALSALESLSSLEELTIAWSYKVDIDDTSALFTKLDTLKRITFVVGNDVRSDDIVHFVEATWKLNEIHFYGEHLIKFFTFIRKLV